MRVTILQLNRLQRAVTVTGFATELFIDQSPSRIADSDFLSLIGGSSAGHALIIGFTVAILFAVVLLETAASVGYDRSVSVAEKRATNLASVLAEVMVSDIEMPGRNGYELLETARARAGSSHPFAAIAVTAYVRDVDRRRAIDAGFDLRLPKPVEPDDRIAAIASLEMALDVSSSRRFDCAKQNRHSRCSQDVHRGTHPQRS